MDTIKFEVSDYFSIKSYKTYICIYVYMYICIYIYIKYTKSKPQCSYLKFRVSTRQVTNMKFVMHRYLILRWGDGMLHNRYLFL